MRYSVKVPTKEQFEAAAETRSVMDDVITAAVIVARASDKEFPSSLGAALSIYTAAIVNMRAVNFGTVEDEPREETGSGDE